MMKPMFWAGVIVAAIGAVALAMFVLPFIGNETAMKALPNGQAAGGLKVWSVTTAALGLAIGSALIGIGLGRWKHPSPSPVDGTPEV